ncbi:UDP-glycosyltransferase 73E1-like [Miscanthus floridulus]|uniref:UDP-glycosyltransferase 73E1-like n=1 Tax=Miscanthus floridulus TaxID=154761 RepID=UPI00345AD6E0
MASARQSNKFRILLMPFFATSHIIPHTDLAFHLAAARPDDVEATVAVTRASASIVQSALARGGASRQATVKVATYPFPSVDSLPPGVENHSTVKATDAWRIDSVAVDEKLMRPGQESLIREHSPDLVITDIHFWWNVDVATDIGVPCVTFHAIGTFPTLAMFNLAAAGAIDAGGGVVTLPGFPPPEIQVPTTELPEMLRRQQMTDGRATGNLLSSAHKRCFGLVVNTFFDLEHRHCEMFVGNGYVKRAYFVGPLSLPSQQVATSAYDSRCIDWLNKKPSKSVVYLCFGSLTHVSEDQLRELALGLEASEKQFLWVIRSETWVPPEGWKERVGDRGMVVTGWAPQTVILAHPAVGVFVTHCGWNSVLETVVAGVPVLTWPMVFEQFITERFVTKVLAIGERLWPEGAGVRSTRSEEHELISAEAVARALAKFMEPGGAGDAARSKVMELSAKARAAMAEGGSSNRDLRRIIDDLMEAGTAVAGPVLSI